MAKQIGSMPISGKIDNLVYYNTKNGGAVVRRAYPNLGKRVKTDKVYANTRRNNAEFGMCGYVASQLLSPILQRWKYILKPDAVGELTKGLFDFLKTNTQYPWGKRSLIDIDFPFNLNSSSLINTLSKNKVPETIAQLLTVPLVEKIADSPNQKFLIDGWTILDEQNANTLLDKGINYVHVYFGGISLDLPTYNSAMGNYRKYRVKSDTVLVGEYQLVRDEIVKFDDGTNVEIQPNVYILDDDISCACGLIIYLIPVKNHEESVEEGSYFYYPFNAQ